MEGLSAPAAGGRRRVYRAGSTEAGASRTEAQAAPTRYFCSEVPALERRLFEYVFAAITIAYRNELLVLKPE